MGSNPVWRIDLQTRFHVSANEAEGPGGTLTLPAVESPRVQHRHCQHSTPARCQLPTGQSNRRRDAHQV